MKNWFFMKKCYASISLPVTRLSFVAGIALALGASLFSAEAEPSSQRRIMGNDVNAGGIFFSKESGNGMELSGSVGFVGVREASSNTGGLRLILGFQGSAYYPLSVDAVSVVDVSSSSFKIRFAAPASGVDPFNHSNVPAGSYDIRYIKWTDSGAHELTRDNFSAASVYPQQRVPGVPRGVETILLEGLDYDTYYVVGVRTRDADLFAMNESHNIGITDVICTLAPIPMTPTIQVIDSRNITVQWDPQNPNGHSLNFEVAISSYTDFRSSSTYFLSSKEISVRVHSGTTYYARVQTKNRAGAWSGWSENSEPATTEGATPNVTLLSATPDSFTLGWSESGADSFVIHYSTNSDFSSPDYRTELILSPLEDNFRAVVGNLDPNTTYYYEVQPLEEGNSINPSLKASVVTGIFLPQNPNYSVYGTSITFTWTLDERNARNEGSYSYQLEVSSTDFATAPIVDEISYPNAGTTIQGLSGNTTYKTKITPRNRTATNNNSDLPNDAFFFSSTTTIPNSVNDLVFEEVTNPSSEVAVSWNRNENNPDSTPYFVVLSTESMGEVVDSLTIDAGQPTKGSFPTSGKTLLANQAYFVRVQAKAVEGVAQNDSLFVERSTFTKPLGPQDLSIDESVTSSTTITVFWSGGNGSRNAKETKYEVEWASSTQVNPYTVTVGGEDSYRLVLGSNSALIPNTTYTITVTAEHHTGGPWTDVFKETTAVTLAKVPEVVVYALYTTSGTVEWNPNGNPDGTVYEAEMAKNGDFTDPLSPSLMGIHVAAFTLTPNTTYWPRVRARNHAGIYTQIWAEAEPKVTDAAAPIVNENDFLLYTDSATVRWNASDNPVGTVYQVVVTDNGDFSAPSKEPQRVVQTHEEQTFSCEFYELKPNKGHSMRVEAVGKNNKSVPSTTWTGRTLAALVTDVRLAPSSGNETMRVHLSWNETLNSDETLYNVELSSSSNFEREVTIMSTTAVQGRSYFDFEADLQSNKRYYGRVKAQEGTEFSAVASTVTYPSRPQGMQRETNGLDSTARQVAFRWEHGNNDPDSTLYDVKLMGPDRIERGTQTGISGLSTTFNVDTANLKYIAQVSAVALDGNSEHNSRFAEAEAFTFTSPLMPQDVTILPSANDVRVWWDKTDHTTTNSADTKYRLTWQSGEAHSDDVVWRQGDFLAAQPLIPNTEYTLALKALSDSDGLFPSSDVVVSTVTLAQTPTSPRFTIYTTSASVQWDRRDNPLNTIFRVDVRTESWFEESPFWSETSSTETVVAGLTPNTSYYAWVRAKNSVGVWTDPVPVWSSIATDPSAPVVAESDLVLNANSGFVSWGTHGNLSGTIYEIHVADDFGNAKSVAVRQEADGETLSGTFDDLVPNRWYSVGVEVVGHNHKRFSSDVWRKKTLGVPVWDVKLEPFGDVTRQLKLTWDGNGNSPETTYSAELSLLPGFDVAFTTKVFSVAASEIVFNPSLTSNQLFYARVKAEADGVDYSGYVSTFTWPSTAEDVLPDYEGLDPESTGAHRISFKWKHGNNNPAGTRYEVQLSREGRGLLASYPTDPGVDRWTFSELDGVSLANQKYTASVRALAADGTSAHNSGTVSAFSFTAPLAPQEVVVSPLTVTTGTAIVGWEAPSLFLAASGITVQNAPDTLYQVDWVSSLDPLDKNFAGATGLGPSYQFVLGEDRALSPNTTYFLKVTALGNYQSPWSHAFTPSIAVTNPAENFIQYGAITPHQKSLTFWWDPLNNPAGTKFKIEVSSPGWISVYHTTATFLTTLEELRPSSLYELNLTVVGHLKTVRSSKSQRPTTLPAAPVILAINKPVVESGRQKIELIWGPGENGERAIYTAAQTGVPKVEWEKALSWKRLFEGLNPNEEVQLEVRADNQSDGILSGVSTKCWTRAEKPMAPTITAPLVGATMGIGFPEMGNPPITKYAIRMTPTSLFGDAKIQKYARLDTSVLSGEALFDSDVPVWLTTTAWLSMGKLFVKDLPVTPGYQIVLYSINHSGEVEGPGPGLTIQQSAGVPLVTLQTAQGLETHLSSLKKTVYYNSSVVPFNAMNSSHYNVMWDTFPSEIIDFNIGNTMGWNGKIDPSKDLAGLGEAGKIREDSVKGFFAAEGEYYLSISGTAVVYDESNVKNLLFDKYSRELVVLSTSPFRVIIDTSPPVPAELQVFFSSKTVDLSKTPISQELMYGDPDPYWKWRSEDTFGNPMFRSPVMGWTYSVSSSSAIVPDVTMDSPFAMSFTTNPGLTVDLRSITETTIFYFKVRAFDQAGNFTPDPVPVFKYKYTPDQVPPTWERKSIQMTTGKMFPVMDDKIRYAAVSQGENFINVEFSEKVLIPENSIQLVQLRDSKGKRVDQPVSLKSFGAVGASDMDPGNIVSFSSSLSLQPGCSYRFFTSTNPILTDRANNPLVANLDVYFYTAMDPSTAAVFVSEDSVARVDVASYALGKEVVGVAINDRPERVSLAGSPSLSNVLRGANDALGRQKGGAYRKIFAAKELTVFKPNKERRTQAFDGEVQLTFDYTAFIDGNGRFQGTGIKAKDLAIYELDERTEIWIKMPNSTVDEKSGHVVAFVRHEGTYAIIGAPNYDLSSAHPFPVPYRADRDKDGISFTNLPSYGTIKILTLDGRLVKTLAFDNDQPIVYWNPVETDSGEAVASDVYLYVIENDKQRVVGKLMVIR